MVSAGCGYAGRGDHRGVDSARRAIVAVGVSGMGRPDVDGHRRRPGRRDHRRHHVRARVRAARPGGRAVGSPAATPIRRAGSTFRVVSCPHRAGQPLAEPADSVAVASAAFRDGDHADRGVVAVLVLSRGREPRSEYVGEASAGRTEQASADPGRGADAEESAAREAEKEEGEEASPPDDADEDPIGEPAPERALGMTVVVRVTSRVAAVILAVAGVYLFAWGYTPGGGFPAGVVLAGVALLLYTAFGHRA